MSFEAETERGGESSGEALFIGNIQLEKDLIDNPDDSRIVDIMEVGVRCVFASSFGVFDTPKDVSVDPGDLFLVEEGSKHFALLRRISRSLGPLSREDEQQEASINQAEGSHAGRQQNPENRNAAQPPNRENQQAAAVRNPVYDQAAANIVRAYQHDGFNKPLGRLPDGRLITWFVTLS